ncbi:IS1595 family transposase [Candidatus Poribacteria bacterium]|nr:IS1595 family transposase [Candidatus Poribacteria bacterium]MYA55026.1 IS1595 family transposase [Candidatus Poribacteria bacterium]
MDFPIHTLIDEAAAETWVLNHFHSEGLCCPKCQASVSGARHFRKTATSGLDVYRCKHCESIYNLYTGTVFAHTQFRPSQVVLLLRGICQGVSSSQLARELEIPRQTVLAIRRKLHASAAQLQPSVALPDAEVETDEMFQNAGEKGDKHGDPSDPPRRRGNKRRGHGTYEKDRPPIVGTKGRESGCLRLRLVHRTEALTLSSHVHQLTLPTATVYPEGWRGYNSIERLRKIVLHKDGEWARDADGDGLSE